MPSSRSIGAGAGALVFAALSMRPTMARAGASARLVYDRAPGAEGCAGEAALRAAVAARLGYDPFFPWARDTLLAEIQRTADGFRARVKMLGEEALERGAREIAVHGESCAALTDAMALTISLVIDPSRMTGGSVAAPAAKEPAASENALVVHDVPDASGQAAPPSALPRAATDRRAVAPPDEGTSPRGKSGGSVTFEAGAQVLAVSAAAPEVGPGFAATFGIAWRRLSLDIEGRFDVPVSASSPPRSASPQLKAESGIAAGQLVPCVHVGWAFGCGVVAVGRLWATGDQVQNGPTRTAFWAGAGGRLGAQVSPFGEGFFLRAFVEVVAAFQTETVTVAGALVYKVPSVTEALGLGAAWRFP